MCCSICYKVIKAAVQNCKNQENKIPSTPSYTMCQSCEVVVPETSTVQCHVESGTVVKCFNCCNSVTNIEMLRHVKNQLKPLIDSMEDSEDDTLPCDNLTSEKPMKQKKNKVTLNKVKKSLQDDNNKISDLPTKQIENNVTTKKYSRIVNSTEHTKLIQNVSNLSSANPMKCSQIRTSEENINSGSAISVGTIGSMVKELQSKDNTNAVSSDSDDVTVKTLQKEDNLNSHLLNFLFTFDKYGKEVTGELVNIKPDKMTQYSICRAYACSNAPISRWLFSVNNLLNCCADSVKIQICEIFQLGTAARLNCCAVCFTNIKWYIAFITNNIQTLNLPPQKRLLKNTILVPVTFSNIIPNGTLATTTITTCSSMFVQQIYSSVRPTGKVSVLPSVEHPQAPTPTAQLIDITHNQTVTTSNSSYPVIGTVFTLQPNQRTNSVQGVYQPNPQVQSNFTSLSTVIASSTSVTYNNKIYQPIMPLPKTSMSSNVCLVPLEAASNLLNFKNLPVIKLQQATSISQNKLLVPQTSIAFSSMQSTLNPNNQQLITCLPSESSVTNKMFLPSQTAMMQPQNAFNSLYMLPQNITRGTTTSSFSNNKNDYLQSRQAGVSFQQQMQETNKSFKYLDKICQTELVYASESGNKCSSTQLKQPYNKITNAKLKNAVREEAKGLFDSFARRLDELSLGCGKELLTEFTHPKEIAVTSNYMNILKDFAQLYQTTDLSNKQERLRILSSVSVNASNELLRSLFKCHSSKGFLVSVNEDEISQSRNYAKQFGPGIPLMSISEVKRHTSMKATDMYWIDGTQNKLVLLEDGTKNKPVLIEDSTCDVNVNNATSSDISSVIEANRLPKQCENYHDRDQQLPSQYYDGHDKDRGRQLPKQSCSDRDVDCDRHLKVNMVASPDTVTVKTSFPGERMSQVSVALPKYYKFTAQTPIRNPSRLVLRKKDRVDFIDWRKNHSNQKIKLADDVIDVTDDVIDITDDTDSVILRRPMSPVFEHTCLKTKNLPPSNTSYKSINIMPVSPTASSSLVTTVSPDVTCFFSGLSTLCSTSRDVTSARDATLLSKGNMVHIYNTILTRGAPSVSIVTDIIHGNKESMPKKNISDASEGELQIHNKNNKGPVEHTDEVKIKRMKFTDEEENVLEMFYLKTLSGSKERKVDQLENVLKLDRKTISTWLRNRNFKEKKVELHRDLQKASEINSNIKCTNETVLADVNAKDVDVSIPADVNFVVAETCKSLEISNDNDEECSPLHTPKHSQSNIVRDEFDNILSVETSKNNLLDVTFNNRENKILEDSACKKQHSELQDSAGKKRYSGRMKKDNQPRVVADKFNKKYDSDVSLECFDSKRLCDNLSNQVVAQKRKKYSTVNDCLVEKLRSRVCQTEPSVCENDGCIVDGNVTAIPSSSVTPKKCESKIETSSTASSLVYPVMPHLLPVSEFVISKNELQCNALCACEPPLLFRSSKTTINKEIKSSDTL